MPRRQPSLLRLLHVPAAAALLIAAAACADRNPAEPPAAPAPAPPSAAVLLRCHVDVRAAALTCAAEGGAAAGVSAAILGGQGTHVRLASSGTAYDAGTATLRSDVTVENLTAQALGTADGVAAAAEGVRVFFHDGPTTTLGSGAVEVQNPDGSGDFTGAGQPYFRYAGLLAPGDTTAPKEWRFSVPAGVLAFTFTVYVAAPVRSEAGWIETTPVAASLLVGDTLRPAAVVRTLTGRALPGEPVVWSSSNPSRATVDASGRVTGVDTGIVNITATSGSRTGSVWVRVGTGASAAALPPTLVRLEVDPTATADGADTIVFRMTVRDAGAGVGSVSAGLRSPDGQLSRGCSSTTLLSGSPTNGVFRCPILLPNGMRGGTWQVINVDLNGAGGRLRRITRSILLAAGAPGEVYVYSPNEDLTPPTLTGFAFAPDTLAAGDSVTIDVTASDAVAGVSSVRSVFRSPDGSQRVQCFTGLRFSGTAAAGTYRCRTTVPAYLQGGAWRADTVHVQDVAGNFRRYTTAELDSAGFPTVLLVTGANPDTVPPAITSFTLSRDSLAANGVDSLVMVLSASDAHSGVGSLEISIERVDGLGARSCFTNAPPAAATWTLRCPQRFFAADAADWEVRTIRATDAAGHVHALDTAQMQAAGYPTAFTVTPP